MGWLVPEARRFVPLLFPIYKHFVIAIAREMILVVVRSAFTDSMYVCILCPEASIVSSLKMSTCITFIFLRFR